MNATIDSLEGDVFAGPAVRGVLVGNPGVDEGLFVLSYTFS